MANDTVTYAGIPIKGITVTDRPAPRQVQRIATGPEGDREAMQGVIPIRFSSFDRGWRSGSRARSWRDSLNIFAYNPGGLQTHRPGDLTQPYETLTATSHTDQQDISGYRAANKRAHAFQTNVGQSKLRWGFAAGERVYVTTSDSAHTLVEVTGATGFTDTILCAREIVANSTRYLAFGTNGQTDDIKGTADISADPLTYATIVAHPHANDRCFALESFPDLNGGWNVYYGLYNNTLGFWYWSHSDAIPATPNQLVDNSTRTVANATNPTASSTKQVAYAYVDKSAGDRGFDLTTLANITASDDSYVKTLSTFAANETTYYLVCIYNFNLPPSTIVGTSFGPEVKQEAASDDISWGTAVAGANDDGLWIVKGGAVQTSFKYCPDTAEHTLSDATDTVGSSSQVLAPLTYSEVNGTFGCALRWVAGASAVSPVLNVDAAPCTVTYRPHGTGISVPAGGYSWGKLPSNPTRWPIVAPASDEQATYNQPRILYFVDLSYHADGNYITGTKTTPNTGMKHVECGANFLGGVAVAGGQTVGPGKALRFIDADGELRNFSFPMVHGTTPVGITALADHGLMLVLEVVDDDAGDAQFFYWVDGSFHAASSVQSESNAIAALPLGWSSWEIGAELGRIYRIFPISTATAAARVYIPPNPFVDPLLDDTTEPKQDGPLAIQSHELYFGPEEFNNSFTTIYFGGRQVSAVGGTYGTAELNIDVNGDTTFATPDVDTGAIDSAFEEYQVPSSGQAFRTAIFKIILNNAGSSSAKTANGLPWTVYSVAQPPLESNWIVAFDEDDVDNWAQFLTEVKTAVNTKPTNAFVWGNISEPAVLEAWDVSAEVPIRGAIIPLTSSGSKRPWLLFSQRRGKTSA